MDADFFDAAKLFDGVKLIVSDGKDFIGPSFSFPLLSSPLIFLFPVFFSLPS